MRQSLSLHGRDMRLDLAETSPSSDRRQITCPPAVDARPLVLLGRSFTLPELREFIRFEDPPFRFVCILPLPLLVKDLEFSCLLEGKKKISRSCS